MDISHTLLLLIVMLLLAVLSWPLAERLRLPFSAVLIITGFIVAQVIGWLGVDTGLRWHHFKDIIFKLLLPILVFESALNIDTRALLRNLTGVLFLAMPVMLLSTLIIATLLFFGINHPGFPWIAALLCGALLSATDPVAVLEMFKRFDISARVQVLMEGESLFNDAVAIVLFSLLLGMALQPQQTIDWLDPAVEFFYVFFGGLLFGLALGLLAAWLSRWLHNPMLISALSLALAYLAFIGAEEWIHTSGVMAVLGVGLYLGRSVRDQQHNRALFTIWEFFAFVANAFVFLLVGLSITLQMFSEMWLAMLLGIAAVMLARAIGLFITLPWLHKLPYAESMTPAQQFVVYWGGLRGAVAVALALSLPLEFDAWYTIQSITYGVVLFSMFVQAPLLSPAIMHLSKRNINI